MNDDGYEITNATALTLIAGLIGSTCLGELEWEGGGLDPLAGGSTHGITSYRASQPHPHDPEALVRFHLRATGRDNQHEVTVLSVKDGFSRRLVHITGCFPDLWNAVAMTACAWPEGDAGGFTVARDTLDRRR